MIMIHTTLVQQKISFYMQHIFFTHKCTDNFCSNFKDITSGPWPIWSLMMIWYNYRITVPVKRTIWKLLFQYNIYPYTLVISTWTKHCTIYFHVKISLSNSLIKALTKNLMYSIEWVKLRVYTNILF